MSVFKFRLQQILELREKQEMQSAAKLAEAETAANEARAARTTLESIRQSGARALHAAHAAEPTIGHLKTIGYVIEQLGHHIAGAQSRVDDADQIVDTTRTELTSALQARRVLSRLRERHLANWRVEDNAQDLRQMDEVALSRFTRRDDDDATGTIDT